MLFRRDVLDAIAAGRVTLPLARRDSASRRGPWTGDVLRLIRARPAVRAADLAAGLGWRPTCSSATCGRSVSSA